MPETASGRAEPVVRVSCPVLWLDGQLTGTQTTNNSFVGRRVELGALLGVAERLGDGAPRAMGVPGNACTARD